VFVIAIDVRDMGTTLLRPFVKRGRKNKEIKFMINHKHEFKYTVITAGVYKSFRCRCGARKNSEGIITRARRRRGSKDF